MTAKEVAAKARSLSSKSFHCTITGGEPLLQLDGELVRELHQEGFKVVAVETNGSIDLDPEKFGSHFPDWICCSPKVPQEQIKLQHIDELKLVMPDYHPEKYEKVVARVRPFLSGGLTKKSLWLQPEDGERSELSSRQCVEYCMNNPDWRVSVQTHKILEIE